MSSRADRNLSSPRPEEMQDSSSQSTSLLDRKSPRPKYSSVYEGETRSPGTSRERYYDYRRHASGNQERQARDPAGVPAGRIEGYRLPPSTKRRFNFCKLLIAISFCLALVFVAIALGFLAVIVHYTFFIEEPKANTTLFVPPQTVVALEMDNDYDIRTSRPLKVTAVRNKNIDCEKSIEFAVSYRESQRYNNTISYTTSAVDRRNNVTKMLLRQWKDKTNPSGFITAGNAQQDFVCWNWGNLRTPPNTGCTVDKQQNCSSQKVSVVLNISASSIDNTRPNSGDDIVGIAFCTDQTLTNFTVNITEYVQIPDRPSYKTLYVGDDIQGSVMIESSSIFSELFQHRSIKLYINTLHLIPEINRNYTAVEIEFNALGHNKDVWYYVGAMCVAFAIAIILVITPVGAKLCYSRYKKRRGEQV